MSSPRSTGAAANSRHHSSRRDAAMERTRSLTRTIGIGSVAAVAALGIYVSRALPGHHAASTTAGAGAATVPTGSSGAAPTGSSGNTGNSGGLSSSSPPTQAQQQSPVVSGSS